MKKEELMALEKEQIVDLFLATIEKLTAEIAELKAQINQNSNNSSKPPSSDGLKKPPSRSLRGKSGKKPGGQPGHKGSGLKIDREPDIELDVIPTQCHKCGKIVIELPMFHRNIQYKYDVKIIVELTKYNIFETVCVDCGETVIADVPECKSTVNYGNDVRTLAVVLSQYGNVSIDKTHKIMRDLIRLPISTGTVKNIQSEFAGLKSTSDSIKNIKTCLLSEATLHPDESGMRVAGKTQWAHVLSSSRAMLMTVHQKRGKEGMLAGGVLDKYTGNLVHDCWIPYFGFDKCKHQLCCAHLLRELKGLIENGSIWAVRMFALIQEMIHVVNRHKSDDKSELSQYYHRKFKQRYDEALAAAKAEIVPSKTKKKSKPENLFIRLEKYRNEIMLFSKDFSVPADNNQAERDIRNVKVKGKVSGGFRTQDGADEFAKTATVIGTAVKMGKSVVETVRGLFAGVQLVTTE